MYISYLDWKEIFEVNLSESNLTMDLKEFLIAKLYNIDQNLHLLKWTNFLNYFDG